MKTFERVILIVGALMMVGLLVKLDPSAVWANIAQVGWGFAVLVLIHIVDHLINAQAWRLSFNPAEGAAVPFWRLVTVRIAGDGVNYLTPSATIAGEVVRPAMLGDEVPVEARVASVVVAKFTQSLGQALFILTGIVFIALARIPVAEEFKGWFYAAVACLTAVFTALILYAVLARTGGRDRASAGTGRAENVRARKGSEIPEGPDAELGRNSLGSGWSLKSFKKQMGFYFRRHPGRFVGSILLFALGYVWGTIEAFLICRFLGLSITVTMAYAIEVLSSAFDGAFFMVPAKMGTAEAGKTAIFAGLGYPAATGFAFGVVRHLRELAWAAFGFALFSLHRRASERGRAGRKAGRSVPETVAVP